MNFFIDKILNYLKNNLLAIVSLFIGLCNLYFIIYEKLNTTKTEDSVKYIQNDTNSYENVTQPIALIKIDIKGAIKKPGVYEVLDGTIINDVITLAGGLNKNACTTNINLSKRVVNEMVIYISTNKEITKNDNINITSDEAKINNSNGIGTDVLIEDSNKNSESSTDNKLKIISINTANVEQLMSLPNIGQAKANNIISYREKNGNFKKIEDIKNVTGIGDSLFAKIKDYITI